MEKEANRFLRQWPEEKIAIENGRWGAFIRFGKKMLKLGLNKSNAKYTPEELAAIELDEVKKMIVAQDPKAFDKKKAAPKKAAAKKAAVKKAAPKK
jgi:DNA topoisomerase-1